MRLSPCATGASEVAKPFLKWAGGKTALLPELLKAAPQRIETYYEPFLGGGALFFALQAEGRFRRAVLSDSNRELINAYTQVRDNVEGLIRALKVHQRKYREAEDRAEYYYAIRAKKLTCSLGGAANLIFMNKTGYNGLYRVNSKGRFNVPHGRYKNPNICDEDNLRAASEALQGVELRVADFAAGPRLAGTGDLVYFDPPYVPMSETAYFTSYTAKEFGMDEQERLANTAATLAAQGSSVALSNSGHPDVAAMYRSQVFRLEEVQVRRAINSKAEGRGPVREYLIQSV
ncbi:MAG: DNA adenine methylase [Chloroflexi bacterium]|nr:DNA adenine methylase [Chloroflexota bacterium]MYF22559.1 DNA adenine methylase [Chloroflexota bacterium]